MSLPVDYFSRVNIKPKNALKKVDFPYIYSKKKDFSPDDFFFVINEVNELFGLDWDSFRDKTVDLCLINSDKAYKLVQDISFLTLYGLSVSDGSSLGVALRNSSLAGNVGSLSFDDLATLDSSNPLSKYAKAFSKESFNVFKQFVNLPIMDATFGNILNPSDITPNYTKKISRNIYDLMQNLNLVLPEFLINEFNSLDLLNSIYNSRELPAQDLKGISKALNVLRPFYEFFHESAGVNEGNVKILADFMSKMKMDNLAFNSRCVSYSEVNLTDLCSVSGLVDEETREIASLGTGYRELNNKINDYIAKFKNDFKNDGKIQTPVRDEVLSYFINKTFPSDFPDLKKRLDAELKANKVNGFMKVSGEVMRTLASVKEYIEIDHKVGELDNLIRAKTTENFDYYQAGVYAQLFDACSIMKLNNPEFVIDNLNSSWSVIKSVLDELPALNNYKSIAELFVSKGLEIKLLDDASGPTKELISIINIYNYDKMKELITNHSLNIISSKVPKKLAPYVNVLVKGGSEVKGSISFETSQKHELGNDLVTGSRLLNLNETYSLIKRELIDKLMRDKSTPLIDGLEGLYSYCLDSINKMDVLPFQTNDNETVKGDIRHAYNSYKEFLYESIRNLGSINDFKLPDINDTDSLNELVSIARGILSINDSSVLERIVKECITYASNSMSQSARNENIVSVYIKSLGLPNNMFSRYTLMRNGLI